MAAKKVKLEAEKEEAAIAMTKAQTSHFKAEAAKLYSDENDKKLANEAFDMLSSGKDISKMSIKGRKLLVDGLTSIIKTNVDELKSLPKDPATNQPIDQDQAKELYNTMENYQKIINRLYGVKPSESKTGAAGGMVTVTTADGKSGNIPADKLDTFLADNPGAYKAGNAPLSDNSPVDIVDKSGKVITQTTADSVEGVLGNDPGNRRVSDKHSDRYKKYLEDKKKAAESANQVTDQGQ
jgi:hypothetical protein